MTSCFNFIGGDVNNQFFYSWILMKTLEKNEKSWENHEGVPQKWLISQLTIALDYQTLYQIYA